MVVSADAGCYAVHRLKGLGRGSQELIEASDTHVQPRLDQAGGHVWGVFLGLFGVASNELIVVSWAGEGAREELTELWSEVPGVTVVEQHLFVPTVRPTGPAPLSEAGLYVFRFFEIDNASVEEIAELSREAWTSFEVTDDYEAEPKALFCQADRSAERGVMLLVTWYDGFGSWETSRQPAPTARENFLRRHRLTRGTVAFATRLLTGDQQ